jgi:hypothetical protein
LLGTKGYVVVVVVVENSWTLNAYMDGKWDVRFEM